MTDMTVSVYLLDWRTRRPLFHNTTAATDAIECFKAGRYEYSFTITGLDGSRPPIYACEAAYKAQGNNPDTHKVRMDRQTMSMGDIARVNGKAYVCASFGFEPVPELDAVLDDRLADSWRQWAHPDEA